jgi:hypothetical protein
MYGWLIKFSWKIRKTIFYLFMQIKCIADKMSYEAFKYLVENKRNDVSLLLNGNKSALWHFQNDPSPLQSKPSKNQKFPCKHCGKEFLAKTLDKYDGSCNKCHTKIAKEQTVVEELFKELTISEKKTSPTKKKTIKKATPQKRSKKKTITKILRRQTWDTHIGMDIGQLKCPICMITVIDQQSYECGHIIAESKNGVTDVINLRPICSSCNKSMATNDMDLTVYNKNLKKQLK